CARLENFLTGFFDYW
nr:immunoglobulin heavy chain junction region [Mus musculus]